MGIWHKSSMDIQYHVRGYRDLLYFTICCAKAVKRGASYYSR